jgi:hypothetical protein
MPRSRWRLIIRFLFLASLGLAAKRLWNRSQYPPAHEMPPLPSPDQVAASLLHSKNLRFQSTDPLQSLWAGYGQICQLTATAETTPDSSGSSSKTGSTVNSGQTTPQDVRSFVMKLITPPPAEANDEGHIRKILSYQVEQYFYLHLAPLLPPSIPTARHVASMNEKHQDGTVTTAMILTDLKQDFPIAGEKRDVLNPTQVNAALDWLSGFHGFWWPRVKDWDRRSLVRPPLREASQDDDGTRNRTVWLNGGYTYLATRKTEYASLEKDYDSEWGPILTEWEVDEFSIAELAAATLAPKESGWSPSQAYMTLIHGDVKSENLFTSKDGDEVVFYDFQYTGLGLGVCDLAKLFTCSVPLGLLVGKSPLPRELTMQEGERKLLERYRNRLQEQSGKDYDWDVFVGHWETALVDWLRFQASWGFWGNTEWLEARVRAILKNETWKTSVAGNARMAGLGDGVDPFVMLGATPKQE